MTPQQFIIILVEFIVSSTDPIPPTHTLHPTPPYCSCSHQPLQTFELSDPLMFHPRRWSASPFVLIISKQCPVSQSPSGQPELGIVTKVQLCSMNWRQREVSVEADCSLVPLNISTWLSYRVLHCPERCQCLPLSPQICSISCALAQMNGHHRHGHLSWEPQRHSSSLPFTNSALPVDDSCTLEVMPFLPTTTGTIQLSVSHTHCYSDILVTCLSATVSPIPMCLCTAARDSSL